MPIYEYRCAECQQLFEEWCKHIEDEDASHSCPICKGRAHRLISHSSFALKGGGWYVTEYGSHKGLKEESSSAASSEAASCTPKEAGGSAAGASAANTSAASASAAAPAAPSAS
jgi:putative FmdB family regulatory protein